MTDWRRFLSTTVAALLGALLGLGWIAHVCRALLPRAAALATGLPPAPSYPCGNPDCDFAMFWAAGRLADAGATTTLYDPARFTAWQHAFFPAARLTLTWIYPPPALFAVAPAGLLPLQPGFFAWIAVLFALSFLLLAAARLPALVIALTLLSPAALWNLELGQLGIAAGAALVFTLARMTATPVRAGAMLGLLTLKPQLGFLAGFAVLAAGRWRALATAALAATALLLASLAAYGTTAWIAYFTRASAAARAIVQAPQTLDPHRNGISVFWMLRSLGAGLAPAYATQAAASAAAILLTIRVWRGAPPDPRRIALTLGLALLATPYAFTEDMVGWSAGIVWMAWLRRRVTPLDVLLWFWPVLSPVLASATGLLLTPLVLIAAAARIAWMNPAC